MKKRVAATFHKILKFAFKGIAVLFFTLSFIIANFWLFDKDFPLIGKQQEPATVVLGMVVTILLLIVSYLSVEKKNDLSVPIIHTYYEGLRLELIKRGKKFWIEEKLNKSLHRGEYIELEKRESSYLVIHPWESLLKKGEKRKLNIKPSAKIHEIFGISDEKLLILGEPGAGKTIALLELAKYKLLQSEKDSTLPIPLIFNLSNWTDEKQTILDWIIDELSIQPYMLPKRASEVLIQNNQCLLLLDSLDAVEESKREACIKALNQFFEEHNFTQIAICSRKNEYSQLKTRLKMNAAISLVPLSQKQINNYLSNIDAELKGLKEILKTNRAFAELAKTPLWLGLMTTIYEKMPAQSISLLINLKLKEKSSYKELIESYTKNIIELYVQQSLADSRSASFPFNRQQTLKWLAWIANRMPPDTFFSIDRLQPKMLSAGLAKLYGIIFGYIMLFIIVRFTDRNIPLMTRITGDADLLINSVYLQASIFFFIVMFFAAKAENGIRIIETWRWSANKFLQNIKFNLMGLVLTPVFIWVIIEFRPIIKRILLESFVFGGLFAILFTGYALLRFITRTGWPYLGIWWPIIKQRQPIYVPFYYYLKRILISSFILGALIIGLLPLLAYDFLYKNHLDAISNFTQAIKISGAVILFFLPITFFFSGIKFYQYQKRVVPNQGILLSLQNAQKAYFLTLILGFIIFFLINAIASSNWKIDWTWDIKTNNFIQILYFSHTVAIFTGLVFGGFAILQHLLLRIVLGITKRVPWRFAEFLNYATSVAILRKIGGEYEFVHEYIRSYFADLDA